MNKRRVGITKVFSFNSAHRLNNYEGKCRNIHGHTYGLEVTVKGFINENGMVIDFQDLERIVQDEVLSHIDHGYLNELLDFNPTCELVGLWLWGEIDKRLTDTGCSLEKLVLWETPASCITINREDMSGVHGG